MTPFTVFVAGWTGIKKSSSQTYYNYLFNDLNFPYRYRFPSGFVVFQVIPVGVFEVFVLIGYMDRKKLFCSSPDLIEALEHPTTFCNIQGAPTSLLRPYRIDFMFHGSGGSVFFGIF